MLLGMEGQRLGAERWGHNGSQSHPNPGLWLQSPACLMSLGATRPLPPKMRSLCPVAEETLLKPGVGVGVGRSGSVGEDLSSPGDSGAHPWVPISAQTVLPVFPVTSHSTRVLGALCSLPPSHPC